MDIQCPQEAMYSVNTNIKGSITGFLTKVTKKNSIYIHHTT